MAPFHRTLADGQACARCHQSEQERRDALEAWLHHYNHHRPHIGCDNQPPFTRLINVPERYAMLPRKPIEAIEPTLPREATDPALAREPMPPVEASESIDPALRVEPIDPPLDSESTRPG